jgi:uncharacterized linocin/CFP29 family protein
MLDLIANGQGSGPVAQRILANGGAMDPGTMQPFWSEEAGCVCYNLFKGPGYDPSKDESYMVINAGLQVNATTLRRDEWKLLDEKVMEISRTRLTGVADLISRGLTYDVGNGMGTTVLEWHDVSDSHEATITMDGITKSLYDRPVYGTNYMPLPIIHVDYEINARALENSRRLGNAIDITSAGNAARKVGEKLEDMLFTDETYTFGGGTIYSYLNHPDRNLQDLGVNWDAAAKTAAEIRDDVINAKQAMIDAKHFGGPYVLYIPTAYETVLDGDFDVTTPGTTIRERLMKIESLEAIKVVDTLTANNMILAHMRDDVVRLVRGMPVRNVVWGAEGNMVSKFKVMTIQVPQIRSDQDGNSGIVHIS